MADAAIAKTPPVMWEPNPGPQTAFIMCPVREILYGGAKGGGKTDAIGPKALKHVTKYGRWSTVLILRENYNQLTEIMERMRPLCLRQGARYNKTEKTWRFPSGARIIFGHLSKGCDPYWGQEYSLIIIDEVTRTIPSQSDYLKLLGSLRNSHGVPCSVILTSNPGGPGHVWVKQRFMSAPPLTVIKDEKTGLERVFIPASLRDNPKLPEDYRLTLEQMNDKERRAFLEGDWSAFEGTVFNLVPGVHTWTWEQFNARNGLPTDNRKPPADWTRFRVMDWGYAKPFAIVWLAINAEGRAFAYREWYGVKKDSQGEIEPNVGVRLEPEKVAEKIASIEKEAGETMSAAWTGPDLDHHGRGDHGGGKPIKEHFTAHGVYWSFWNAAPGSRLAGKMALHQRLHFELTEDDQAIAEYPGLIFITEECPHAIRTLPALEYDEHQPELVDTEGEDHEYDAISGFCKMRTWTPPPPAKKKSFRDNLRPQRAWGVSG